MDLPEPEVAMLASAAGLAGVVWLIMQLVRPALAPPAYDRWAPTIAAVVGIVLAELYVILDDQPDTGLTYLGAVLVGLFGGWMSQNVNTMVRRAIG